MTTTAGSTCAAMLDAVDDPPFDVDGVVDPMVGSVDDFAAVVVDAVGEPNNAPPSWNPITAQSSERARTIAPVRPRRGFDGSAGGGGTGGPGGLGGAGGHWSAHGGSSSGEYGGAEGIGIGM
jgi:hypothetical protein